MAAAAALFGYAAQAENILVNPGFEANSGHSIPEGWERFAPPSALPFGNYWIEGPGHSGTVAWKQWGASYLPAPSNNVAGLIQDFSSAPGSVYQAEGWFFTRGTDELGADCRTWIEVSFLDESDDLLALYRSDDFTAALGTDEWFQLAVTNACDLSAPISTGDPYFDAFAVTGSVSQLVAPLGTARVRFLYAYLQSGTQGGSAFFDDAVLDQVSGPIPPVISHILPLNMIFVDPADGISFQVHSPSGFDIDDEDIRLILNTVDVSESLAISGTSSNKSAAYFGLESNTTYTASISVTDSFEFTAAATTSFETQWVGIDPILYLWEAEDYDFGNGMYINDPELCVAVGNPNCYFGKVGVEDVDYYSLTGGGSHLYRPDDLIGTAPSGDFLRRNLHLAGRTDYKIDPFIYGEWLNYTRDWPSGIFWIVGRLATEVGFSGALILSRVEEDSTMTDLGVFRIESGRGWSTYDNVYLQDENGFPVNVELDGTETLRLTSEGNLLPNCFMLVEAIADLPRLSNLTPSGKQLFEYGDELSFSVTTLGATFPPDGIRLILDGADVSAHLEITGSDSTVDVVYPALRPNALHTAVITVTNSLGNGISLTNRFDTFSQTNFMVEAEDFDYGGGQFVTNWFPESYSQWFFGPYISTTNVDFHHTPFEDEEYVYRVNGVPQDLTRDSLRDAFVNVGAFDHDLTWFGDGDWVNYTRDYPEGSFYVYGRFSGLGPYSIDLDEVTAGVGTTNQVTQRLGRWGLVGRGYDTYDWVPLTDEGLEAPMAVTLNGRSTLRITTSGNSNLNYFMLVPAPAIELSAGRSGDDVTVSWPTEPGVIYRLFYRDSLTGGFWSPLANVVGDGSVMSVSDPADADTRFYKADE